MSIPITFALLDDKQEELDKLATFITSLPNMEVVYKTQKETQLFNYLAKCTTLPRFILVDIKFGERYKEGYYIVERIHQKYPTIHLLLCSEYPDESYTKEVIASGSIKGLLKKQHLKFNLQRAIGVIENGGEYWLEVSKTSYLKNTPSLERNSKKRLQEELYYLMSPDERKKQSKSAIPVTEGALKAYLPQYEMQEDNQLTVQQWLIFKLVAKGYSSTQIVDRLSTSAQNLHVQKSNIREYLEISGQGDVAFLIKALELGVVEVREFIEKKANITIVKQEKKGGF